MFRCQECNKTFRDPRFFTDEKGEQNAVCPNCNSYEYVEFETTIAKDDVLTQLLEILRANNNYCDKIRDLYGISAQNDDLDDIYGLCVELIEEMYGDFVTPQIYNCLRHLRTDKDVQYITLMLEGDRWYE